MSKNKILKSTLLNIDSSFRNLYPKNICRTDNQILPANPLILTKQSNIATFNYPNHGLQVGDNIVIQNIEGITKTLINTLYLINNFKYLIIYFENHGIPVNYKLTTDELYINIEISGSQTESNMIQNIPLNSILGIKKCLTYGDIPDTYSEVITSYITFLNMVFSTTENKTKWLNENLLFIELPNEYITTQEPIIYLKQVFKISYMHIGGIKLGYFNSNYPINNYNYQSNYSVLNILDQNRFQIQLNYSSYGNISGGGKTVQVMKIINSIDGYPDADNYVINLKKSFNNVISIELYSSEFPYVDLSIQKNTNDKLYWKNIEDGETIYSVQVEEGFYTSQTLLDKLKVEMNKVPRTGNTVISPNYNYFDINFEANIQKITFSPYNIFKLPNCLSLRFDEIDSDRYYIMNITHPFNIVEPNDIIEISQAGFLSFKNTSGNSSEILILDSKYINKKHTVYSIQMETQTYDIILGKVSEVELVEGTEESAGGENIEIKTKTKVSFLFNKSDTMGSVLGFLNVGDPYSVTNFSANVSNKDSYAYSINLDTVGNELTYSSGFLNLSGKYNYILMYLNDIEYIYSNNNLASAFSKILLAGNPGDILYNTYVSNPTHIYSKNFPISTLTQLTIKFVYPDGSRVNFRNINHSFTLNIIEEQNRNDDTYLNSQSISVPEEFKKANLKD
jgi:hypothetical protein